MDKQPLIKFIQENTPNILINNASVKIIASHFDVLNLSKNEYLIKEGRISGYYYMAAGFLRAFTFDLAGNDITTNFYWGNRVVFEPSSFFMSKPSVENIQAVTDCKGYYTTFEKLNGLFHTVPGFREFARAMLVKEFVTYKSQTLAMINKSAEERYTELVNNNKQVFQHAQLRHIASFLGITDTSLSRIRRDFVKK